VHDAHTHRILVVEDNADVREVVAATLTLEHYDVDTAENGAAALERLRGGSLPCLILLDLHMPVMDGFAFRRAQQADAGLATIPVVVVSVDTSLDQHVRALGVAAAVHKDDFDGLVDVVRRHCTM
jgi:CheY-like chemotaxis protein